MSEQDNQGVYECGNSQAQADLSDMMKEVGGIHDIKFQMDKDEARRMLSLMLGIRYYTDTIIKDPVYLKTMMEYEEKQRYRDGSEKAESWHLRPATVHGVINCASVFEAYLKGQPTNIAGITVNGQEMKPERTQGEVEEEVIDQA